MPNPFWVRFKEVTTIYDLEPSFVEWPKGRIFIEIFSVGDLNSFIERCEYFVDFGVRPVMALMTVTMMVHDVVSTEVHGRVGQVKSCWGRKDVLFAEMFSFKKDQVPPGGLDVIFSRNWPIFFGFFWKCCDAMSEGDV